MRTRNSERPSKENVRNRTAILSNSLFVIGTCIMLTALVYMITNLEKADSILTTWIIFLVTGLLLVVLGVVIRPATKNSERKTRSFTRRRTFVH